MRELLFKGKRKDNGEWVYGWYAPLVCNDKTIIPCIRNKNGTDKEVIPETVGQYTGLTDKNGKMIFEGDICRVAYLGRRCDSNGKHYPVENVTIKEVVLEKGAFCFKTTIEYITIYRPIGFDIHGKPRTKYYEVIGNVFDNNLEDFR